MKSAMKSAMDFTSTMLNFGNTLLLGFIKTCRLHFGVMMFNLASLRGSVKFNDFPNWQRG